MEWMFPGYSAAVMGMMGLPMTTTLLGAGVLPQTTADRKKLAEAQAQLIQARLTGETLTDKSATELPGNYKTALCKYFEAGNCSKGEGCMFAHGAHDLRQRTGGAPPPQPGQRGYKTSLCKFFSTYGNCTRGDTCTYAHGEAELQRGGGGGGASPLGIIGASFDPAGGTKRPAGDGLGGDVKRGRFKTIMCQYHTAGHCNKGDACTYAHSVEELSGDANGNFGAQPAAGGLRGFKTRLCNYWLQGSCSKGTACSFAHGPEEMGQPVPAASFTGGFQPWNGGGAAAGLMALPGVGGKQHSPMTYKTQLCKYFPIGKCTSGTACVFAHGEEELNEKGSAAAAAAAIAGALATSTWTGAAVAPTVARFKTRMCKYFLEGTCTKDTTCTFAHSESELQKPVDDGVPADGVHKPNPYGIVVPGLQRLQQLQKEQMLLEQSLAAGTAPTA